MRGFLTTPIERAVSAISGVDYVESTSRAGISTVTVRLKLNHNSTAALAEVTARLQQVRSELPAEAEPPVVEVQRADRPYASFYLSFTSNERDVPAITDWLARTLQPQLATLPGVQRVTHRRRPAARDAGLDRSRPARGAQPRAGRRARGAPAQQLPRGGRPDQGQPGPDQPARQHRPALGRGVREPDRRRSRRRHRAPERRRAGGAGRRRGRHGREVQRPGGASTSACGRWSARTRSTSRTGCGHEMERIRADAARRTSTCGWRTTAPCSCSDALKEITKTLAETILIVGLVVFLFMGSVRTALVPLVAMPVSLVGAAIVMYAVRLQPQPADDPRDRAVGRPGRGRRDRRGRERRAARARGQVADRRRRSIGARELVGPIIAMTITLAAVYTPIGFQGGLTGSLFLEFAITLAAAVVVSGIVAVTLSPVMSSRLRARARRGRPAHAAGQPRLRRGAPTATRGCSTARSRCAGRIVAASLLVMAAAVAAVHASPRRELAPVEDQSHISLFFEALARRVARGDQPRLAATVVKAITSFPETRVHVVADGELGRVRRHGREGLERAEALDRADVRRGVRRRSRRSRACACSRGSIRRCRRPGSTTSSWCSRATRRPSRCSRRWARSSAPAGRAASSCTSTPTSRSTCPRPAW